MDLLDIPRVIFALLIVIGLIGLGAAAAQRYQNTAARLNRLSSRRLKIIETLYLDPKRRVLIIRRDDREHVVLLGPQTEAIIETDIEAVYEPEQDPAQLLPQDSFDLGEETR